MLEWIRNDLARPAGVPVGSLKIAGLVITGVFLALAAVFSVPIPVILAPVAAAAIGVLFFFRPTWGIITSVFLLSVKRLFSVVVGIVPLFTVNRALVFWVLTCLLLHRFVFRTRGQFHRHDQNRIALLWVVWYSICSMLSLNIRYSVNVYGQMVGNVLLFFLIYQLIDNRKQLGTLLLGYIALLPMSGILSIIGFRLTRSPIFGTGGKHGGEDVVESFRAAGVAGMEANNYAVVMVLFAVVLVILLWWKDLRPWSRGLVLTCLFGNLFMLTRTLSRTGMILFFLAATIYVLKYRKRIGLKRFVIGGMIVVIIIAGLASEKVVDRFFTISEVKDLNLSEDQSISNRIGLTLMLPKLIAIDPIFGVGPGNIPFLTAKWEYRNYVARNLKGVGYNSHNQYVELIGETGFIGFSIFVLLMGLGVRDLLVSRRLTRNSEGTFLWCLVEAFSIVIPLYFFAAGTLEAANKQAFWIIMAMPIIIRRLLERDLEEERSHSSSPAPSTSVSE